MQANVELRAVEIDGVLLKKGGQYFNAATGETHKITKIDVGDSGVGLTLDDGFLICVTSPSVQVFYAAPEPKEEEADAPKITTSR